MGQETNTQAVRYAEAVADDDMLHEDDLRRMRDEYCERRELRGAVAADAQWAEAPFDHWLAGLSAQPRAIDDDSIAALVVGCVVAFGVSLAVIRFLMDYVKRHDFKFFGAYRIVLGIIVLAVAAVTAIV